MRQRLELYIDGLKADTDGASLVLFNYAIEDLQKPTVVKNSYSRQIALKATSRNNRIFQSCFRMDRVIGDGFDPRKRVPFQIFADGGRIVEAGYLKLDGTKNSAMMNYYNVTLFGGLGGFFYGLAYNGGDKRTFADLDFLGTDDPDSELDFTINAAEVNEAWDYFKQNWDNGVWKDAFPVLTRHSIIQFAPAYNGIPENFDTSHALVVAGKAGLETSHDADGKHYETKGGYALVDLGQGISEFQACDLRAYMQRPVVSVYALIQAIIGEARKQGYTIDLDAAFFRPDNPYYTRAWMALPMLTDIVRDDVSYSGQTYTWTGGRTIDVNTAADRYIKLPNVGEDDYEYYTIPNLAEIATGYKPNANDDVVIDIAMNFNPNLNSSSVPVGTYGCRMAAVNRNGNGVARALMIETYGRDQDGNLILFGPVKAITSSYFIPTDDGEVEVRPTMEQIVEATGYQPYYHDFFPDVEYGGVSYGYYVVSKSESGVVGIRWAGGGIIASLNGKNICKVEVRVQMVMWNVGRGVTPQRVYAIHPSRGNPSTYLYYSYATLTMNNVNFQCIVDGATRSDTLIKKKEILSLSMTPADFLLYYCRRFGLMFRTDPDGTVIHIETRNTFFKDEVYDIDDRIAIDRGNEVNPLPFDARTLQMMEDGIGGEYPERYERIYGRPYGSKRLHTDYEFNSDVKDLFERSVFRTAAEVMKQDKLFVTVMDETDTSNIHQVPSPFLLGGMKYRLYVPNGIDFVELDVPTVSDSVRLLYYNSFQGYDKISRMEFQDADNRPVDGTGVLMFMQGFSTAVPGTAVTDDNALMYSLASGPCWYLDPEDAGLTRPVIPMFGRYIWDIESTRRRIVKRQMDFGTPAELDIPGVYVDEGSDVYARFWDSYISDRYNKDTKTVTLYISTRGLPMNLEQMRPFFWFRGSLWSLNKIVDYDLTGDGITKCEFVQVQDRDHYRAIGEY